MPRQPDPGLEERILNAAQALWNRGGEKSLTMRAVARAAGTNTPAVYRRFKDRRDLIRGLLQRGVARLRVHFEAGETLEQMAEAYVDEALRRPHEYELFYAYGRELSPPRGQGRGRPIRESRPNFGFVEAQLAQRFGIRSLAAGNIVTTLAGSAISRGNTDGPGNTATFSSPMGIARDTNNVLYVADAMNHTIRKIAANGTVSTFAGGAGIIGSTDGTGTAARFNFPSGISVDSNGTVYVADTTNNLLRKITSVGVVTTLAGVQGVGGFDDGTGSAALFHQPEGLATDLAGNIYLADTANSTIRKITPAGIVTTIAGLPTVSGLEDGPGVYAMFKHPQALCVDANGSIFVADTGNATIRKIDAAGNVTTLTLTAGTAPAFTTQPASQTVTVGASVSFTAAATGSPAPTYQWKKDNVNIVGATTASYSIASATMADAGNFTVTATNAVGAVTSTAAALTVNAAPTPSAPAPSSSYGGGGGGAPTVWFFLALPLLAVRRMMGRRKN